MLWMVELATNGWKCKYCPPMETSIEGVCFLEMPDICQPRFSSTSCLIVCGSDPHFLLWYSTRENFIWFPPNVDLLASQNKSFRPLQTLWLSFSVKHFTLLIRSICLQEMFFLWAYFFKRASDWIQGVRFLLKSNILSLKLPELTLHRRSRTF